MIAAAGCGVFGTDESELPAAGWRNVMATAMCGEQAASDRVRGHRRGPMGTGCVAYLPQQPRVSVLLPGGGALVTSNVSSCRQMALEAGA